MDKSDHLWSVPCLQLFDGEVDGVERVPPVRRRHRDHDARLGHPHDADPVETFRNLNQEVAKGRFYEIAPPLNLRKTYKTLQISP